MLQGCTSVSDWWDHHMHHHHWLEWGCHMIVHETVFHHRMYLSTESTQTSQPSHHALRKNGYMYKNSE